MQTVGLSPEPSAVTFLTWQAERILLLFAFRTVEQTVVRLFHRHLKTLSDGDIRNCKHPGICLASFPQLLCPLWIVKAWQTLLGDPGASHDHSPERCVCVNVKTGRLYIRSQFIR